MTTSSTPSDRGSARPRPWFAALTGITSLLIFVQAITAGEFVSQKGRDWWIDAHGVVGDLTMLAALVTAVYALVALRRTQPGLAWGSVALFALLVVQAALGYLITGAHQDGWIGVHVPLAFVVFGLTVSLSVRAAIARRAAA